MTTNTALQSVATRLFPALAGSQVTYLAEKNLFLTPAFSTPAGNSYLRTIRLTDHLIVCCDVGIGYSITFLNGITLYAWDGQKKTMIGRKQWGGCGNWVGYSEAFVREQSIIILQDYLKGQMKMSGQCVCDTDVANFARQLVDNDTCRLLQ